MVVCPPHAPPSPLSARLLFIYPCCSVFMVVSTGLMGMLPDIGQPVSRRGRYFNLSCISINNSCTPVPIPLFIQLSSWPSASFTV
ncbi:hypothetical protein Pcar_3486 [Syntrophotalea carbinolica DSM 2380]|uniref:Uncharacterized protein n=1 Tax=Syntrophotalea carbinolica (strain DSM 2380 / NBRC 103641 / GraBd1) TaxID=338963 RepID=J9UIA1_SYNC1|nr:hypothetical protein Pcar_3486 [Syntrophotalea carbinolica DSM 2380]